MRKPVRIPRSAKEIDTYYRWIRKFAFLSCLMFFLACSQIKEKSFLKEEEPPDLLEELTFQTGLNQALTLIEDGKSGKAQQVMETLLKREELTGFSTTAAVFYLATVIVLEKKELQRLQACKETFQLYSQKVLDGDERENAEKIVQLFDTRIKGARDRQLELQSLYKRMSKQKKALKDLEYKLQKLEEIQQEAETKRKDFHHR